MRTAFPALSCRFAAIGVLLGVMGGAGAQRAIGAAVTETHTLTLPGGTVTYYITKPNGYSASATYPMIVNFPGAGRDAGTVDSNQGRSYTRRFLFDPTPMATNNIGVALWYTGWLANYDAAAATATIAVMNQVRTDLKIDPKRIFALGFSAGGYGLDTVVWGNYFASTNYPFAGVMVCSCNGELVRANPPPAGMPVFLEYGTGGDIASCISSTQARNSNLQSAGYTDLELHAIAGQAHEISGYDHVPALNPNANQLIAAWWNRVDAQIGASSNLVPTITALNVSPTSLPLVGQMLTFSVATAGGAPTTIRWTFGDGAATNGSPVTHAYASLGAKSVSVVASNAAGSNASNVLVTVVNTASTVLPCIADTYLAQDVSSVSNNYGSLTYLISNADKVHNPAIAGVPIRDALLKFDLSSLPAGAVVTSGVLHVYCSNDAAYDTRFCTFQIRGVLQDWAEMQTTWLVRSAGNAWTGGAFAPGESVNYDTNAWGSAVKSTNELWTGTYRNIDITALVQAWAGGRANHGLVIQTHSAIGTAISSPKRTDFASRETANPAQLHVGYALGTTSNSIPRITAIPNVQSNSATLTWTTQSGQVYRMEYTANLLNTNWVTIGIVTAATTLATLPDSSISAVSSRFYRVSLTP